MSMIDSKSKESRKLYACSEDLLDTVSKVTDIQYHRCADLRATHHIVWCLNQVRPLLMRINNILATSKHPEAQALLEHSKSIPYPIDHDADAKSMEEMCRSQKAYSALLLYKSAFQIIRNTPLEEPEGGVDESLWSLLHPSAFLLSSSLAEGEAEEHQRQREKIREAVARRSALLKGKRKAETEESTTKKAKSPPTKKVKAEAEGRRGALKKRSEFRMKMDSEAEQGEQAERVDMLNLAQRCMDSVRQSLVLQNTVIQLHSAWMSELPQQMFRAHKEHKCRWGLDNRWDEILKLVSELEDKVAANEAFLEVKELCGEILATKYVPPPPLVEGEKEPNKPVLPQQ